MLPPAPGRFSMTTGCPHIFCNSTPSERATMSVVPPGGNGTIMRTGFDGQLCACAVSEEITNAVATNNRHIEPRCIFVTSGKWWAKSAFTMVIRLCWPQHGKVHTGAGSGDHKLARNRVRSTRADHRDRTAGVPADFSATGLG